MCPLISMGYHQVNSENCNTLALKMLLKHPDVADGDIDVAIILVLEARDWYFKDAWYAADVAVRGQLTTKQAAESSEAATPDGIPF